MAYSVVVVNSKDEEKEARQLGKFDTLEEAVATAHKAVDDILRDRFSKNISEGELFSKYRQAGLFPYIFTNHDEHSFNVRSFNHYEYALRRCRQLCEAQA